MRALGCIWNDINDVDIDQKVLRTKNRMIVSKKVTKFEILTFSFVNLSIGVIPLFYISDRAVVVAFLVVPLIVSYPFMKRITWWPQFWLGLNFNWGLFVGFASVTDNYFSIYIFTFYLGCIAWTIAYDTVYGFQDILDDELIGVKSTSIKFKKKPKTFIFFCYLICYVLWSISLLSVFGKNILNLLMIIPFFFIIIKLIFLRLNEVSSCEKFFKQNCLFGMFVTLILIIIKLS